MSANFFGTNCSEPARSEELFGLCDDQDGTIAYTDLDHPDQWVAEVINAEKREILFTAIDACIVVIREKSKEKESTCDGMLTTEDSLYLVELKDYKSASSWRPKAISQLENTIKIILANHDLKMFRYKKGFACNKGSKNFMHVENEMNLRFFRTYGFRIDSQRKIIIK